MTIPSTGTAFMAQPLIAAGFEGFVFGTTLSSTWEGAFVAAEDPSVVSSLGQWLASASDSYVQEPAAPLLATPAQGPRPGAQSFSLPNVRLDRSQYWADRIERATVDDAWAAIDEAFARQDVSAARAILKFLFEKHFYLEDMLDRIRYEGRALSGPVGEALYAGCLEYLREGKQARDNKILFCASESIFDLVRHGFDCSSAVPLLLAPFMDGTFEAAPLRSTSAVESFVRVLGSIGDQRACQPLLDFFERGQNSMMFGSEELYILETLGAEASRLAKLQASPEPEEPEEL